ncbi:MAG: response regulator [Burkholderiaceae bacterium]|jgi:twitching motility two-component system response regulator PilH|nr:response regulator [Burkholderiaceae bacterium]
MPIYSVLVVDDSMTELTYLSEMLRKAGYVVSTARGSEEAQRHLEQSKPDLILMDVVMPGKNGFQLTRLLSGDPRYAEVPIIICSSKNQEVDRAWGLRQGARDYIVKPVNRTELINKIKALE